MFCWEAINDVTLTAVYNQLFVHENVPFLMELKVPIITVSLFKLIKPLFFLRETDSMKNVKKIMFHLNI